MLLLNVKNILYILISVGFYSAVCDSVETSIRTGEQNKTSGLRRGFLLRPAKSKARQVAAQYTKNPCSITARIRLCTVLEAMKIPGKPSIPFLDVGPEEVSFEVVERKCDHKGSGKDVPTCILSMRIPPREFATNDIKIECIKTDHPEIKANAISMMRNLPDEIITCCIKPFLTKDTNINDVGYFSALVKLMPVSHMSEHTRSRLRQTMQQPGFSERYLDVKNAPKCSITSYTGHVPCYYLYNLYLENISYLLLNSSQTIELSDDRKEANQFLRLLAVNFIPYILRNTDKPKIWGKIKLIFKFDPQNEQKKAIIDNFVHYFKIFEAKIRIIFERIKSDQPTGNTYQQAIETLRKDRSINKIFKEIEKHNPTS